MEPVLGKRSEIQARIAELDRQINAEVAGTKLPSITDRRRFPVTTWILAAAAFAWTYLGGDIPGVEDLHRSFGQYGLYAGAVLAALAAWGTLRYLLQPSTKITPEYRESVERVRALQEERRELMAQLKEFEQ